MKQQQGLCYCPEVADTDQEHSYYSCCSYLADYIVADCTEVDYIVADCTEADYTVVDCTVVDYTADCTVNSVDYTDCFADYFADC